MNKKIKDISIFIAISFFGISGIVDSYYNSSWSVISSLWEIFMFFATLFAVVYSLFYLVTKKERTKPFPRSIWMILSYSIFIYVIGLSTSGYFKELFLYANYDGGIAGTSITLFKDSTYEVNESSFIGGDYYRGTYIMKGDTIVLDRKICFNENYSLERKMVIDQNIIYQLDSTNHKQENDTYFNIIN